MENELSYHCYFGWMGGLLIFLKIVFWSLSVWKRSYTHHFVSAGAGKIFAWKSVLIWLAYSVGRLSRWCLVKGVGFVLVGIWIEMIPNSHDLFLFYRNKKMIQNHQKRILEIFFQKTEEQKWFKTTALEIFCKNRMKQKCQSVKQPVFFCTRPDSYLAVHYPNPDRWMCRWGSDFDRGWHRTWNHGIEKKGFA